MAEGNLDNKQRDRTIAANESAQQTTGDIRVSVWAIALALLLGLGVFGWVLTRS